MVPAHSQTFPALSQLDPGRILGMAGAITANAAAMLLLLAPVSAPAPLPVPDTIVDIFIVEADKPEPPPPPPPEVEIRKQTTPTPVKQPVVAQPPVPDTPILVTDPGPMDLPPPDLIAKVDPGPVGPPIPVGPAEVSALEYLTAPPPPYPREALAQQIEGTVTLRVLVDVDGKPLEVEIRRSSGNRRLDDAARRQIMRSWRFKPAIRDGVPIQVYGIVPVEFSLN